MTSDLADDPAAPRVLNVDDDEAARYYKSRVLKSAGWTVREASTGAEALAHARDWLPDLVLLDVRLPDIDGLKVCRQLKTDPDTAPIMVLQTSATFVTSADRVRGLEGGADHYLAQPFGAEELVATSRALYRIRRAEVEQKRAAEVAHRNAERLAAQNDRLSTLSEAAAGLLRAQTIEDAFATMYSTVAQDLGADMMLHYRVTDDGRLELAAHAGLTPPQRTEGEQLSLGQGMCGLVAASGVGRAVTDIQTSDDPQMSFLRRCGVAHYVCMPLVAADRVVGTLSLARRGGAPFSDDEKQFVRTLASYVSLAYERIRAHQQLTEQTRLLQEADRNKDEFLAMLAHELRNPLAPIVNAARLLRVLPGAAPDVARLQSVIERQSQHLTRLLDDLLDVARVSRGKIVLQREVVSAQTVAAAAVEALTPQAQEKRQSLRLEIDPEPMLIEGDRVRLTQILTNLLHNAIKFTPPAGRIELSVSGDAAAVHFGVRDDGCGIPAELTPHLFKLFVQGESSVQQPPGSSGLGLGLALVRRLAELHGGRVSAQSEGRNRGAEFVVELPRHHATQVEPPAASFAGPPDSLRVMIVDDNRDAANTLAEVLRFYGHSVEALYSGTDALQAAARSAPDAILLDLAMPDKDGYQTARELRGQGATASTFLVALSGYGQPRDRQRSTESGFDAHLVKPVDIEQLVTLLGRAQGRNPVEPEAGA